MRKCSKTCTRIGGQDLIWLTTWTSTSLIKTSKTRFIAMKLLWKTRKASILQNKWHINCKMIKLLLCQNLLNNLLQLVFHLKSSLQMLSHRNRQTRKSLTNWSSPVPWPKTLSNQNQQLLQLWRITLNREHSMDMGKLSRSPLAKKELWGKFARPQLTEIYLKIDMSLKLLRKKCQWCLSKAQGDPWLQCTQWWLSNPSHKPSKKTSYLKQSIEIGHKDKYNLKTDHLACCTRNSWKLLRGMIDWSSTV